MMDGRRIQKEQIRDLLQSGEVIATIIFKEVPADVCENCGEYYLSEAITGRLLERAEQAVQNGTEIEIARFAA